jgi:serine phosphatase RsbU (regulator of sigma subunit)/serine/threonine protein kinase/tetratricopeptide (TPR) repeat protein
MGLRSKVIANRYKILEQKVLDTMSFGKLCEVYDALDQDNKPVTIQILSEKAKQSSLERLLRFKREVERVSKATHENLIRIYEYGEYEGQSYFVTEHVNGAQPLSARFQQALEVDDAANIILQVCSGLAVAHEKGIIHQFINPSSILIFQNGKGPTAKLSDFGIGLLLDLAGIKEEDEIIRTFGFMSPEATGILRKPIDERSDIYSLGIIFYQLLTRRLPYEGRDTSTLIHQHIAQKPTPPSEINPSIPPVLEKIVMRLIAKDPLDRYQTVFGLYVDLQEYILRRKRGEESPSFEIARSDRAAQISFATRLIGREKELDTLQNLIAQTKQGKGGFALVYGSPGVGKSRLVDELRGYIHSIGGIFVGGKCYQYESTNPFNVFSEALDAYVLKIKRIGKEEQNDAIKRIRNSVGALGAEVVKIAPTIVDLIGEQPELESLEAEKERVRFMMTVSNFLLSLGSAQNPFIMFLDDLQWADEGSIELLGRIAESVAGQPIAVIASYRDTDVYESHPWVRAIGRMKEKNIHLTDILVKPFGIGGTARIVSEILMEDEKEILPLSKELHERTSGNAFFVLELLHSLVDQQIVYFKDNHYRYDLDKIDAATLPTNVVEVVLRRVDEISEENKKILAYASLMGREIEFKIISDLTDIPREIVIDAIEDGIKNQLLTRDITGRENVVFMHDRIREALYKKVSEEERVLLHGQIAQLLEEQHKDNVEPVLFELAHHFAQAKNEEKTLDYSLRAGKKAQVAYSNDQAIRFYNQAKTILERKGTTTTEEYIDLLENLGLVYKTAGRFDEALKVLKTCEQLIPKEDKVRRAEVLSKAGDALWEKGEGVRATELLGQALKSLGVKLPMNMLGVVIGLLKESLIQGLHTLLPGLFVRKEYKHDAKKAVIVRLLLRMAYFYYFTNLIKTLHLGMKYLNMGERMGPSRLLSNVYSTHTVIWAGVPFAASRAKKDGERAVKIAQELHDRAAEGSAYGYYAVSTYSNRNVKEAYEHALESIDILKGIGEYWDLGMGLYYRPACGVLLGKNLETLLQEVEEMIQIAQGSHSLQAFGWGLYHKARLLALIGDERLTTEGIQSGEEGVKTMEHVKDKATCLQARSYLALAHLRAGNYEDAVKMTEQMAVRYLRDSNAAAFIHDVFPISAQVYLDCVRYKADLTEDEKRRYLKKAKRFCKISFIIKRFFPYLRSYSYQVNGTFQWLCGNKQKAVEIWEQGITYIRENTDDTYRLASILLEEASCILKDNPQDTKAKEYLMEAKEIFEQLGAKLDFEHTSKLLQAFSPEEVVETRQALTLTRHLDSLLSVTKAIGSIFILEDLLEKIVEQAMKVTGAERGFLLLYDEQDKTLKQKVARGVEQELTKLPFSYDNYKVSLNIVQEVEKTGKGLFAGEESTAHPQVSKELKDYGVKEAMCVPLKAREKALGMIYLDNRLAGGTFGEEEHELMKSFAVQASISIENAYLVSNLVEQERLKQEMELGRQIQLSLLPEETPQIKGFAIAGLMQPAKEIGGDYFDYITFAGEPNRLGVVVADVTGKGVDAGMVMGMTKATIHALSEQNLTTRDLVLKLNRYLCTLLKKQKFISLAYAEYSAEEGTFTWSGAGHEHIIVVRSTQKGDHEVKSIVTGGIVLGVFDDIEDDITQTSITLNKGDKVILYTDGVTEAMDSNNKFYSLNRLIEVIKHASSLSAQDLLSHINENIRQHIGDSPQYDDITLVVMEKK